MARTVTRSLAMGALLASSVASGPAVATPSVAQDPSEAARAVHLLNRIGYGPRPGDVARVLEMGVDRYLELQLRPASIPDADADRYLAGLEVLGMSTADLGRVYAEELRARRARQQQNQPAPTAPMRPAVPTGLARYLGEFQQAAVARAVLSERQLYEVMVDFWTNHFNVFLGKGIDRFLMPAHIAEAIRPNALGRFEDLLVATSQSPAMLVYLDNVRSVMPGAEPPQVQRLRDRRRRLPERQQAQRARADSMLASLADRMPRGLNENYARELLELHTLGVDGGYTQDDVVDVARILTGWGIRRRADDVTFVFNAWAHDTGDKIVLGRAFPAGRGMEEGLELLAFLARHPTTMRFVSTKLCERFVSDTPPNGCIDAGEHAWRQSDGEMREVLRAILTTPEFWSDANRGAKIKTPLEFVASAVRALGAAPDTTLALAQLVARLGQPLYLQPAPTGYPERQDEWVNSGALLARFNLALAMAASQAPGVAVPNTSPFRSASEVDLLVDRVNGLVLNGTASARTLDVMRRQAEGLPDPAARRVLLVGLALGSPEFQRQ